MSSRLQDQKRKDISTFWGRFLPERILDIDSPKESHISLGNVIKSVTVIIFLPY